MEQNNQKLNKHIEEYLDYYFDLSYPPGFAILLKGEWGSGKTWLIDQYREKPEYKNKKILYVSLYGMTSYAEIENAFFQQLYPIRSSKAFAVTEQIFRGLLKASLRIDLNQDGEQDTVSLQIPQIDLPKSLDGIEEIILIFDDLERCQIDIGNILGYINSFVEHKKSKVIILANEDEILKQEDDNTQIQYQITKEKLIGKTFCVSPDLNSALISFTEKITDSDLKNFLLNNEKLIRELYHLAKYENLRTLQHIFLDFERLYTHLPEKARRKPKFLQEILQILISFSIETKRKSREKIYIGILQKDYNICFSFPDLAWWEKFIYRGEINCKELESLVLKHRYIREKKTQNWLDLEHFSALKDNELEPLIKKVESEYASRQFKTIEEVKHITGIFLKLSSIKLYERNKQDILQQAKLYIDWLKSKNLIEIDMQNLAKPSFEYKVHGKNVSFHEKNSDEFKELCAYIDEVKESIKLEIIPQLAEDLLSIMQSEQYKFYRMICEQRIPPMSSEKAHEWDQIYFKVPLFQYINPEQFVDKLLTIPCKEWRGTWSFIFTGLKERYQYIELNKDLIEEFDWINSIYNLLLLEADRRKNKISGYNLKSYTEGYLDEALENILESLKLQIIKISNYLLSNSIHFISFSQYILSDLLVVFKDWYLDIENSP